VVDCDRAFVVIEDPTGGRMNLPPMAGHLPEDGGGCWDGIWWPEAAAVFGGVQAGRGGVVA
jgi:hypothetical protein